MCAKGFFRPQNIDNRTALCIEDKDYLKDLCSIEHGKPQKAYEKIVNDNCKPNTNLKSTIFTKKVQLHCTSADDDITGTDDDDLDAYDAGGYGYAWSGSGSVRACKTNPTFFLKIKCMCVRARLRVRVW